MIGRTGMGCPPPARPPRRSPRAYDFIPRRGPKPAAPKTLRAASAAAATSGMGRLRRLVLRQRPVDHVDEATGSGIVGAFNDIHQAEQILALGEVGKAPHRAGRILADGF